MAYGQTRIIYAMSRDGLLAAFVPLNVLGELVNIGTLAAFCLVSVAVIILRKKRPDLHRAFRCPGVPVIPALAVIFCLALMSFLSALTWMAFGAWLLIGLVVYFGYARTRSALHGVN
jgi:APA family basic amino acid/polyamine antiporter